MIHKFSKVNYRMDRFSTKDSPLLPGNDWHKPMNQRQGTNHNAGFTILELVIVMSIITILAAIGIVNYQKVQAHARETVLKQDLQALRKAIDQYTADKEELPQSLDDLVTMGYIREIPPDPITSEKDWKVDIEEDTISRQGGQGVVDVHSAAPGEGLDGVPFSDY